MTEFRLPPFETAALLVKDKIRTSGSRIFSLSELRLMVQTATTPWPYDGKRPGSGQIIETLIADKAIRHLILKHPEYKNISRYAFGSISILELATSLKSNAYLSHWSAVDIHGLSTQRSPTVYVNREQSPKPSPKGPLSQPAIDRAFAHRQRQSKYVFSLDTHTFTLLSGKQTKNYGVTTVPSDSRDIRVTDIPRTLIDIMARPSYAGGVKHVVEIFRQAVDKVEVNDLIETLRQVNHKYPYHQALGYYLMAAGVSDSKLAPLKDTGLTHKFYLDYGMADPKFDDTWQVYVPANQ